MAAVICPRVTLSAYSKEHHFTSLLSDLNQNAPRRIHGSLLPLPKVQIYALPLRLVASDLKGRAQQLLWNQVYRIQRQICAIALANSASDSASLNITVVRSSSEVLSAILSEISKLALSAALFAKAIFKSIIEKLQSSSFRSLKPEEVKKLADLELGLGHATLPLCFAAISRSPRVCTPLTVIAAGMAKWLELYSGVLLIRVLLSWFPNIPWDRQPLQAIRDMCDPYLNLFRNLVPPVFNALDVSPMFAFFVLGLLASILNANV